MNAGRRRSAGDRPGARKRLLKRPRFYHGRSDRRTLSLALDLARLEAANLAEQDRILSRMGDLLVLILQLRKSGADAIESQACLRVAINETVDDAWKAQIEKWELESGLRCPGAIRRRILEGIGNAAEDRGGFQA